MRRSSRPDLPREVTLPADHEFVATYYPGTLSIGDDETWTVGEVKDTRALRDAVPGWSCSAKDIANFAHSLEDLLSEMSPSKNHETIQSLRWVHRLLFPSKPALQLVTDLSFQMDDDGLCTSPAVSPSDSEFNSRATSPLSARSSSWSTSSQSTSASSVSEYQCITRVDVLCDQYEDAQLVLGGLDVMSFLFDDETNPNLYMDLWTQEAYAKVAIDHAILTLLNFITTDANKTNELFFWAFAIDEAAKHTGITSQEAAGHMTRVLDIYIRWYRAMLEMDTNVADPKVMDNIISTRHTENDVGIRWRQLYERFHFFQEHASRGFEAETTWRAMAQVEKAIVRRANGHSPGHSRSPSSVSAVELTLGPAESLAASGKRFYAKRCRGNRQAIRQGHLA